MTNIPLTEAQLKSAVEDYLQIQMNQGLLYFDRLNSGDFIEVRGNSRRRIKGCRKGTADFFVLTKFQCGLWIPRIIFLELKSFKGRSAPEQMAFKVMIEEQMAEYFIIQSVEELMKILEVKNVETR